MKKSLRFCFKVDKSVKMVVDKNGNGEEAFACIKATGVESYTLPSKDYKDMQEAERLIYELENKYYNPKERVGKYYCPNCGLEVKYGQIRCLDETCEMELIWR